MFAMLMLGMPSKRDARSLEAAWDIVFKSFHDPQSAEALRAAMDFMPPEPVVPALLFSITPAAADE